MNVGTPDRRHGYAQQHLVRIDVPGRELADHERRVGFVVDDGTACFRDLIIQCFYAVPLIAKSKISWLLNPPAAPRSA